MRDGWIETTLGEIADYQNGYPFKPQDLGSEGLPVVRIRQLLNSAETPDRTMADVPSRHRIDTGDLIFSWSGTLAVKRWNRGAALLNQHLFRVVERDEIDRSWLALALEFAIPALEAKTHGSTMKHITKKSLLPHPVRVPPIAAQRRIADLVASLDAYIASAIAHQTTSETLQQAMIDDLFAPSEHSPTLGELGGPGSIRIGPFGSQLHASDYETVGVPIVMPRDLIGGHISRESLARVSEVKAAELGRYRLRAGDVLLPRRGDLTKRALVREDEEGWLCGTGTVRVRVEQEDPELLYFAMSSRSVNEWLADRAVGATMPNLNVSILSSLPIPIREAGQSSVETIRHLGDVAKAAARAHECALAARSAVLRSLVEGEHAIPESYDALLGVAE